MYSIENTWQWNLVDCRTPNGGDRSNLPIPGGGLWGTALMLWDLPMAKAHQKFCLVWSQDADVLLDVPHVPISIVYLTHGSKNVAIA